MAGPFVLGISSGASLGVAIAILAGMGAGTMLTQAGIVGDWFLTLAASMGAFLILLVVVAVSAKVRDSMSLLIIGLMFGSTTFYDATQEAGIGIMFGLDMIYVGGLFPITTRLELGRLPSDGSYVGLKFAGSILSGKQMYKGDYKSTKQAKRKLPALIQAL